MTSLVLSVRRGPKAKLNQTRQISNGVFAVGRASPSDWVLDDPACMLSKRHCLFRQDSAGWTVVDISRNGTFVERQSEILRPGREPLRLIPGDRLRIGAYELFVELEEDEASFQVVPLAQFAGRGGQGRSAGRLPFPPQVPSMAIPQPLSRPSSTAHAVPPAKQAGHQTEIIHGVATEATRGALGTQPTSQSQPVSGSLDTLLDGASMARSDVQADDEDAVLRAAGAALRSLMSGLREIHLSVFGEPTDSTHPAPASKACAVTAAGSDREALRWLFAADRRYDVRLERVIEAAFADIRMHHDCLVQAARQTARTMFEKLDPEEPSRSMLPHWLDLLPGWRRTRERAVLRRRYRRMAANLDRMIDRAFAQGYSRARREADKRLDKR